MELPLTKFFDLSCLIVDPKTLLVPEGLCPVPHREGYCREEGGELKLQAFWASLRPFYLVIFPCGVSVSAKPVQMRTPQNLQGQAAGRGSTALTQGGSWRAAWPERA